MLIIIPKEKILILEALQDEDQNDIKKFKTGKITAVQLSDYNQTRSKFLREIIDTYGFPTITTSSLTAYRTAILIALHSEDADLLDISIKTLTNAKRADVDRKDIAFLTDKARIIRSLPQLYGTQFRLLDNCRIEFIEIEDEKNIDTRRRMLGLESFSEYKKRVSEILRQ